MRTRSNLSVELIEGGHVPVWHLRSNLNTSKPDTRLPLCVDARTLYWIDDSASGTITNCAASLEIPCFVVYSCAVFCDKSVVRSSLIEGATSDVVDSSVQDGITADGI